MADAGTTDVQANVDQLAGVISDNPDPDDVAAAEAAAKLAADTAADTAAGGGDGGGPPVTAWPDKWREQMAGADDKDGKRLTRLGRFDEPGKIFDSMLEVEKKYKSSDIRSPFPEEGNDKDKAKWRKDNAVPAEAGGYFEKLPDGLVIGEEDKPGMDVLAEAMHAKHAPADNVHTAVGVYYKLRENALAAQAEADAQDKKDTDDALNELYGADFRRNINDLGAWLDAGGKETKAKVLSARTPDGTPLGNDPDFIKFMVGQMRTISPLVTVPGLGGGDPAASLNDEIAAIEKTIQTDNAAYRADKALQERYLTLLDAREKHK